MRKLLIIAACLLLLPIIVYAHPGQTDGNGGHYDRSTGEYHYHHGYPEHDHHDMDGDGNLDCPYDFIDATNNRSGSSSSSDTVRNNYSSAKSTAETVVIYQDREVIKEIPYVPKLIKWILAGMGFLCLYLFKSRQIDKEDIERLEKTVKWQEEEKAKLKEHFEAEAKKTEDNYGNRISQLKSDHSSQIQRVISEKSDVIESLCEENRLLKQDLHSVISTIPVGEAYFPDSSYTGQTLYKIEIPQDVYFINDNVPVRGIVTKYHPFGDYTMFTSKNSSVYHDNEYCGTSFKMEPVHLFEVMGRKRSCLRCGKPHGDEPPEWYRKLEVLKNNTRTHRT